MPKIKNTQQKVNVQKYNENWEKIFCDTEESDSIKSMSVKEFLDGGYLQEVNRRFLHPLGLALEVIIDDNDNYSFGRVWDYRDDPEGMLFSDSAIIEESFIKNIRNIDKEWEDKIKQRTETFGFGIQSENDFTKIVLDKQE